MTVLALLLLSLVVGVNSECYPGYKEWVKGRCFKYVSNNADYPTSKAVCVKDGTMMMSIHTVKECEDLDLNVTKPYGHFWLGLECDAPTQRYIYTDGSETSLATQYVRFPCVGTVGYHHHTEQMFIEYSQTADLPNFAAANTLCYHFVDDPPTSDGPATFGPDPTQAPSNISACGDCQFSDVWLDILFVVDSSASMTQTGIFDVQSHIGTVLSYLQVNRTELVRVGIIVYSDKAEVTHTLGSITTPEQADNLEIKYLGGYGTNMEAGVINALAVFSDGVNDLNARKVIVLFASGFRSGSYNEPTVFTKAFKDEGGIIITVDYSKFTNNAPIPMLHNISSPGYKMMRNDELADQLGAAFCDANCYCPYKEYKPYTVGGAENDERLPPSGGCFSGVTLGAKFSQAERNCELKHGYLASIHSDDEQFFSLSLVPTRKQFWIGLHKVNGIPQWTDGLPLDYTHYGKNASWANGDCAYNLQISGFNSGWFPTNCETALMYACEVEPCSALNRNCTLIKFSK